MKAALAAAAALAALALVPGPAHAASRPERAFFGTQAWSIPNEAEFARMGRGHVGTLRAVFSWGQVEPQPGQRNWVGYDFMMARAARQRIDVLPVIVGSPPFAASRETYPPRQPQDVKRFLTFVTELVDRYGRRGRFWSENPDVPYRPVDAYQAWNETSLRAYWFGRPSARQYVRLLRGMRRAIKRGDRRATVVLGGLPESRTGIPMVPYLRQLYANGARTLFDVVALHPYASDQRGVEGALIRVRQLMARNGDARKPIWLTELGWASAGPRGPFVAGVPGQASKLERTFRLVLRTRSRYRVEMAVWFSFRDRPLDAGERDWWAPHTGLFDQGGNPKPAWESFTDFSGGDPGSGPIP